MLHRLRAVFGSIRDRVAGLAGATANAASSGAARTLSSLHGARGFLVGLGALSKSLPGDVGAEIVEPVVQGVIYKLFSRYMEGLLAEELATQKMRYTLELKDKRVKETEKEQTLSVR